MGLKPLLIASVLVSAVAIVSTPTTQAIEIVGCSFSMEKVAQADLIREDEICNEVEYLVGSCTHWGTVPGVCGVDPLPQCTFAYLSLPDSTSTVMMRSICDDPVPTLPCTYSVMHAPSASGTRMHLAQTCAVTYVLTAACTVFATVPGVCGNAAPDPCNYLKLSISTSSGVPIDSAMQFFAYALYDNTNCGTAQLAAVPKINVQADIAQTVPGTPYVCTGTHKTVTTGKVSGTVGGGAVVKAEVSVGVEYSVLEQYDFACDYGMWLTAVGEDGFMRKVHLQVWDSATEQRIPVGRPCEYNGITSSYCETSHLILKDAFSGAGIAGPLGGGTILYKLPTQVRICPPEDPYLVGYGWNDGWQDLPTLGAGDNSEWSCQEFAIHYQ